MEQNSTYEYKTQYVDFQKALGNYPKVRAITGEIYWDECQALIFRAIRSELSQGWIVDQGDFGSHILKYHYINMGWTTGQQVFIIIFGFLTLGIGFLITPLFIKQTHMIVLEGFEIKLMRRKVK